MTTRARGFLIIFFLFPAAWPDERGEIGLRLEQVGIVWTVVLVTPGGAAEKAGLQLGDIVFQINNRSLPTAEQLSGIVSRLRLGDLVELKVQRHGEVVSYELKATSRPD